MSGEVRRNKANGGGAVMGEREAYLAIAVGPSGSLVAGCRGGGQEGGSASRKDQRMTVLSEQHRLKEHRKNAEQRGPTSGSLYPRPVRPDPPCR